MTAMDTPVPLPAPPPQLGAEMRSLRDWLQHADERGSRALNLVPSENRMSPLARLPLGTDFYHRYFFNGQLDPGFWEFRGGEEIAGIEVDTARYSLSRLSGAPHVNTRPISGLSAMLIALSGLGGPPGRAIVSIAEKDGGHYATAALIRRFGHEPVPVPVERGEVDTDVLAAALTGSDVALVYLDLQNSRHLLDVGAAAACVRRHSPGTALHVDCSHTLGLVLGGAVPNPLDLGADSMGGSTHKSFPGPHKGVLFTRSEEVRARLESAQFVLVSSHHFAETLALGIAAREFEHFGPGYAQQVVANARRLGTALLERGFDVAGAGDVITDNHQVWVHVGDADVTNELSGRLAAGGIRVNVQVDMPGLPGPALRLGANETTFEGATEPSMELLADAFAYARDGDAGRVSETREAVLRSYGRPYHLDIPLR